MLLLAISLPLIQWQSANSMQSQVQIRSLQTERLSQSRVLHLLTDHVDTVELIKRNPMSIEAMTLEVIEAINQFSSSEELALTQLTVSNNSMSSEEAEDNNRNVSVLNVEFALIIDEVFGLLNVFDVIDEATQWRPIEIRGCTVTRLSQDEGRLHAACTVDAYYFPGIDR